MTAPTAAGARELARAAGYRRLWQAARAKGCEDMAPRALRRWRWHLSAARSWSVGRVAAITARYQSRAFDGMTDGYNSTGAEPWMENGEWVRGTSCGIHHNRTLSESFALALARVELAERWGNVGTLPTGPTESWLDQYPQEGVKGERYCNWRTLVYRRAEGDA